MTHYDIFRATVEHRKHEPFLFEASYTPDLKERMLEHFEVQDIEEIHKRFDMPIGATAVIERNPGWPDPDYSGYFEDIDIPEGAIINENGVLNVPGSLFHFSHRISPLRNATTLTEIESFPYPTAERYAIDEEDLARQVQEAHDNGMAVRGAAGHIYENAWQIRGYEEFLIDLYQNPEHCCYILEKLGERAMALSEAYAKAGVDILHTADDVANQNAMMFDPHLWRMYMKPIWARIIERAKTLNPRIEVFYHSDGNITEIIPLLLMAKT